MLTTQDILWGIVYPGVIAMVVMLISHWPTGRRAAATQSWGPPLALAIGFIVAIAGLVAKPALNPVSVQGWLVHLCTAAVIVGLLATFKAARRWIAPVLSIATLVAVAWLLQPAHSRTIKFTAIVAGAMTAWWIAMATLARRHTGAGLPTLLAGWAGCAALVITDSGTQSLGQLAGSAAVMLAIMMAAAWWFRNLSLAHGGMLAVAVIVLGLILLGHRLADLTTRDAILLAAGPLAIWFGELPGVRRQPWLRFAVATIAMFGVLAIALVPAVKGLYQTMTEQTESTLYEY